MDKRFLLALVLTAVVVIATPWLFGTQSRSSKTIPADSGIARRDSLTESPTIRPPVAPTPEAIVATDSGRPASVSTRGDSVLATPVMAESTVVVTSVADYRFTNIGALPLSVELKSYRALDGSRQNVRLASATGRLLSYRLFLRGDTVDLSHVSFQLERSRSSANAELLTYRASVAGADVAIRYAFAPDSYLVRVSGEVRHPSSPNGFIGVEMPTNLQSAEADSLDDQQHLA